MTRRLALILAALPLLCVAVHTASAEGADVQAEPKLESVFLAVDKVASDQIATAVQTRVSAVKGVRSFVWIAARKEAKVVRVAGQATTKALIAACKAAQVTAVEIPVSRLQLTFQKKLHCNGCVIKVKRALKAVKGTKGVRVAKDRTKAFVAYDAKLATVAQLRAAVASVGYPATNVR